MAQIFVMYRTPADPAEFDRYYFGTHVPIAKKIPGLRRYEVSDGRIGTPGGVSDYHLIATLTFDSRGDIEKGLESEEGKAAAADLANFAGAGVELFFCDTKEV